MKVVRVEIRDFRGIANAAIDLRGSSGNPLDLVVLAGPNACGKTTVLEACLRAFRRDDLLPQHPDLREEIRREAQSFDVGLTVDVEGTEFHVERTDSPSDRSSAAHETRWTNKRTGKMEDFSGVQYFSSWRAPKLIGSVPVTAGRRGRRPAATEENRLWRLKQYLVNLTARKGFEQGSDVPMVREGTGDAFDRLNGVWSMFYPDRHERFVARPVSDDVEAGFDVFLERAGKTLIPMDALSSGEMEVLCLLGLIAAKEDRPEILFLDEPELHLHPAWHRKMLPALGKILPETQIIAATHSPQVLGSVPAESVRLLRNHEGTLEAVAPGSAYGLDADRILEDIMGVPEREPEVDGKLRRLFDLIDRNELSRAKGELAELRQVIAEDPELAKADALIRRKEALGR